jgi:hypothetical protein
VNNHRSYCRKQGYTYIETDLVYQWKAEAVSKYSVAITSLAMVQRVLRDYEYVVFINLDSVFVNTSIPFSFYANQYPYASVF